MTGSCNRTISLQPRVIYFSTSVPLILALQAGPVTTNAVRLTFVHYHLSAQLLFSSLLLMRKAFGTEVVYNIKAMVHR